MRPPTLFVALAVALPLAACQETASCPEGTGRPPLPGGGYSDECVPFPDASIDGGGQGDGGNGDAGPCGRECSGDTPLCRASDGECVACLGDGDCEGETPRCDLEAGSCVACLEDADCASPDEPRCDTTRRACAPCTEDAQCARFDATPACGGAAGCVQCTATSRTACGPNVCDASTSTCTERPAHSRGLCRDCVADDECMPGMLCVPMTFMGTDLGHFCLWREDASEPTDAPSGTCTNVPPYAEGIAATSIDGTTARVCTLKLTTCEAINDFRMQSCTEPAVGDSECGVPGLDDGLCRMRDATTYQCTVPCVSDDDCLPGVTCNTDTRRYCNF